MRFPLPIALAMALLGVGCEPEPLCVDKEGEELPSCTYEIDEKLSIDYCPGDEWGASDGCNSCACGDGGRVLCTEIDCAAN